MSEDNITPIRKPAAGLAPEPKFPKTVEEKIIVAKAIVMAVTAADQSGNLDDENYERFWPLRMATELLDQAADQIDEAKCGQCGGNHD